MKFIYQNLKPIAVVVLATCVGALFGHALVGFCIGTGVIALITIIIN